MAIVTLAELRLAIVAREYKPWALGQQFSAHMAREVPGRGAELPDDGVPGDTHLRFRSIPNVPTERLQRRQAVLHEMVRTPGGLARWDETRRALVEQAVHLKGIEHELSLRMQRDA